MTIRTDILRDRLLEDGVPITIARLLYTRQHMMPAMMSEQEAMK